MLLKAETISYAHIAMYEKAQARFTEAAQLFVDSIPFAGLDNVQAPIWNTVSNCFKKIFMVIGRNQKKVWPGLE